MQEVLHAFGIDWRLIVIQMFNFAILAGLLWYFLYTPILKILNDRQRKIEQGVKDADAAHDELVNANTERSKILTTAQKEAEGIVERASDHAVLKGSEIVQDAENKATRILTDAKAKGEEIKSIAEKESEAEIARLAILAAEKVLRERK